jgi:hypothetical protein
LAQPSAVRSLPAGHRARRLRYNTRAEYKAVMELLDKPAGVLPVGGGTAGKGEKGGLYCYPVPAAPVKGGQVKTTEHCQVRAVGWFGSWQWTVCHVQLQLYHGYAHTLKLPATRLPSLSPPPFSP